MSSVVVPRPIPVALLGLGGVGKAILSQLLSPPLSAQFQLVLIANSRQSLSLPLPAAPITPANFQSILEKHGAPLNVTSVISVLSTHPDAPGIFIDSTGSDVIPAMYPQILSMGVHIVTPNKKGFSASEALYKAIAEKSFPNTPSLAYGESTVGAGLPIIQTLKDLVATGDEIEKIEGVFSGTLSYIFNEFSKPEGGNVKFSEVVKVAKEKGYTEPDPRDDLSGTDVARKLSILSRLVPTAPALPQGYASIPTQSLVPDVLSDASTKEEYLERLEEGDEFFANLREEAKKEGQVVRYVGVIDVKSGKVEAKLGKYPADHAFATALKGSDNIISFTTKRYSPRPLIIQGAGAGADVTAMGVTSDMVKIYERLAVPRI
ncbi:homoserine dehydrogenase [Cryptococcus neoformans C23]|uniref:Homoserine dehydrogenase n=2 Tax=Cryptococcus neoformans TaxID=5207 RepID=A0A854QAI9_CRYNE|nr:homoserine dehydrogenase [Cryptococcus neoformans var. grubii H99]AUB27465.1 homoserine dehydrogenase [Cryptococcus neoformans var. grubii]OWZ28415.1 homoserine dehydrogenase [Cryptococcus neoformans var. grubii AD2-60a]OWZ40362.1 homoserine dehydrogenase [Cryptococcus neoformans var. grubii C23]OXC82435.1 homoserine dehydrogenase [Cryptococcus neoformans var. grubii AD1-7a]OXG13696.1 homoserine dehydrogenase [Cryptococcus neoformans var. grubii Tu259-1]|eukprot:XP_012052199.1 homoserine dehydrogenase [Cryptococcus neoformans var. grubii H99]